MTSIKLLQNLNVLFFQMAQKFKSSESVAGQVTFKIGPLYFTYNCNQNLNSWELCKQRTAFMLEHQIWLLEDAEINAGIQAPNKWVNKDTFSDSQIMGICKRFGHVSPWTVCVWPNKWLHNCFVLKTRCHSILPIDLDCFDLKTLCLQIKTFENYR